MVKLPTRIKYTKKIVSGDLMYLSDSFICKKSVCKGIIIKQKDYYYFYLTDLSFEGRSSSLQVAKRKIRTALIENGAVILDEVRKYV